MGSSFLTQGDTWQKSRKAGKRVGLRRPHRCMDRVGNWCHRLHDPLFHAVIKKGLGPKASLPSFPHAGMVHSCSGGDRSCSGPRKEHATSQKFSSTITAAVPHRLTSPALPASARPVSCASSKSLAADLPHPRDSIDAGHAIPSFERYLTALGQKRCREAPRLLTPYRKRSVHLELPAAAISSGLSGVEVDGECRAEQDPSCGFPERHRATSRSSFSGRLTVVSRRPRYSFPLSPSMVSQSPALTAACPTRARSAAASIASSLHPTIQGFPICRATRAA